MTVPNTAIFNNYAGNDSTTVFPYGFKIFAASDLEVIIADASDTQYVLILNTDYTVSGVGEDAGGNVTYTGGGTPLPTNWIISIALNLDFIQETDLENQGEYFAEVQETALDRLTKMVQMLAEEITRCLKVSITSGVDPSADTLVAALNAAVVAAELAETGAETAQTAAELAETNAETAETNAETAETNAAASAAAAAVSAATIPAPGGAGNATKHIRVNAGGTAYELTDVQAATGAQIDAAVAASHAEAHTAASHSDQTATGAQLDALVAAGSTDFGAWDGTKTRNTIYQAATNGFVIVSLTNFSTSAYLESDAVTAPSVVRARTATGAAGGVNASFCCPVKKDDYWRAVIDTASFEMWWIPLS